jgi:septal ring factor EnvC (AmiA/AmiB activator)
MPYRSRRRRGNSAAILLLLFLFCFSAPAFSQTDSRLSKRELENKKKRINDEIRQINAQLSQTKANKKSSIGTLLSINVKLKKRQELIQMINQEIALIDKDISKNQQQVSQLKASLEKLKREYARMIVFAQRNQDEYTALMFIFSADNFNQAYARMKYIQQYSEYRRRQAIEIINTQTQLLGKLNELKSQQNEKVGLLGNEKVQQQSLSTEKKAQEEVLGTLQKKEKELKSQLEKKKQDAALMQLAIKKLIEADIKRKAEEARKKEEARRIAAEKAKAEKEKASKKKGHHVPDAKKEEKESLAVEKKENAIPEMSEEAIALSADFSNNRGKLPWPVQKGVICETYGEHEHPALKGFMIVNNGIEICCSKGTQARAVFEGVITGIAFSPAGGKLVIIRHGEYLTVYSNLSDVVVKTGQKVMLKQVIGTVQHDEDEDKSQIGFQIWKEQNSMDPKTMDPGGWLLNGR